MNKFERGPKILVTVLIYCIFSVSLTAETKITFEIPLDIDYKTEKNESQVFQMFRFERHPDDPDYWGMDLPSFVVAELLPINTIRVLGIIETGTSRRWNKRWRLSYLGSQAFVHLKCL